MSKAKLGDIVMFKAVEVSGQVFVPAGKGKVVEQHYLPMSTKKKDLVDVVHLQAGKNVEVFDRAITVVGHTNSFRN